MTARAPAGYHPAGMDRCARRWLEKPWFVALLVTALAFRALLPPGFMPGATDDGGFGLRLCSLHAPSTAAGDDPAPRPDDGGSSQDAHGVCPFAATLAGAAPPLATLSVPLPAPSRADFAAVAVPRAVRFHSPAHRPRGPPLIA